MELVCLVSSFVNPEVSYASLDFEAYLDSTVATVLTAVLVFFAFVLFVYILCMVVQYLFIFWAQLKESKPERQEISFE